MAETAEIKKLKEALKALAKRVSDLEDESLKRKAGYPGYD